MGRCPFLPGRDKGSNEQTKKERKCFYEKTKGGTTTKGPTVKAPVAPPAAAPTREKATGTDPAKDKITLPGENTNSNKVYALVNVNGNFIKPDGALSMDNDGNPTPHWEAGTGTSGSDLSWTGLEPDAVYRVLTADKDGGTTAPAANAVPAGTPVYPSLNAEAIEVTVDPATGKGTITVGPVEPGAKYTVGNTEKVVPADGIVTFDGLTPGSTVELKGPGTDGAALATVTVPAVDMGQLTGAVASNDTQTTDDDASITIDPSVSGVHYAVVDGEGKLAADSKPGTGGALTLDGLKPGEGYKIVVLAEAKEAENDNTASEDEMKSAVPVVTPTAPVSPDKVQRAEGTATGKDKTTVSDTDSTLEYAVVDKTTDEVVAPAPGLTGSDSDSDSDSDSNSDGWVSGTGSALEFDGLDPNKTYDVVTRKPADAENSLPAGLPSQGVGILPRDSGPARDKVSGKLGDDGKWNAVVEDSDANTKYAVVDKATGKVVAPINGDDGDGWVTGSGGKLELGPLPAGNYAVVSVPKASDDNETGGNDTAKSEKYPAAVIPAAEAPIVKIPVVAPKQLSGAVTG